MLPVISVVKFEMGNSRFKQKVSTTTCLMYSKSLCSAMYIEDNTLVGVKYEKFVTRKPDSAVTNESTAQVSYYAIRLWSEEFLVFHTNQCIILFIFRIVLFSGFAPDT